MNKISRRVIALLLAAVFATAPVLSHAAAYEIPDDVKLTEYEQAVIELMQFKVMKGYEDGSFRPDARLTRAEFSAIVVRAMGLEDVVSSKDGQSEFTDVPYEYWGAGYINVAYELGIINGYGDGTFGPEDEVTGIQTLKMLVCALGYEIKAEENGGYPNGYLIAASGLQITNGADFRLEDPVSRGNTAILVRNALDVDLMERQYGKEGIFNIVAGKTLMTNLCDLLDLEKKQGIITGDGVSGLREEMDINDKRIFVDDMAYASGLANAQGILGYSVTYYIHKENEEIYSIVKDKKNQTLTIKADEIDGTSEESISYNPTGNARGNVRKASLTQNIPTIYNGRYFASATPQDLHIDSGSITLLDNNNDGVYDVVFVNDYTNYMIGSVDAANKRINLKVFSDNGESRFSGNTYIDCADSQIKVRLMDKDRKSVEIAELKADQVISVFSSKDGKLVTVTPAYEKITGTVDELSFDGEAVINGEMYKLAKNSKSEYVVSMQIGDDGTFWLDVDGYITAMNVTRPGYDVETINNEMICSYILQSDVSTGLDRTVQIKVLSSMKDGTRREHIFTLSKKVSLDGTVQGAEQVIGSLNSNGGINRPILYKINGKGEITDIYTFNQVGDMTARIYYSANTSFDNLFFLDDKSIKYFVDVNDNGTIYENAQIKLENSKKYSVKMYDPSDSITADGNFSLENRIFVISVDLRYTQSTASDMPMLVKTVRQFMNSDNERRYRVEGLIGQEFQVLNLNEDQNKNVEKISNGTLMTFTLNGYEEIRTFKVVADLPPAYTYRLGTGGVNERLYGQAQSIRSNSDYSSCILTLGYEKSGKTEMVSYEIANKPVYMYTSSSGDVKNATTDDIYTAEFTGADRSSYVLAYVVNYDVKAIVIVR